MTTSGAPPSSSISFGPHSGSVKSICRIWAGGERFDGQQVDAHDVAYAPLDADLRPAAGRKARSTTRAPGFRSRNLSSISVIL